MRKIVFRGKTKEDGVWIGGNLVTLDGIVCIFVNGRSVEVDPETVGQFTDCRDRNGVRIFEGDILKAVRPINASWEYAKVAFQNGCFGIHYYDNTFEEFNFRAFHNNEDDEPLRLDAFEVVCDVHDFSDYLKLKTTDTNTKPYILIDCDVLDGPAMLEFLHSFEDKYPGYVIEAYYVNDRRMLVRIFDLTIEAMTEITKAFGDTDLYFEWMTNG